MTRASVSRCVSFSRTGADLCCGPAKTRNQWQPERRHGHAPNPRCKPTYSTEGMVFAMYVALSRHLTSSSDGRLPAV